MQTSKDAYSIFQESTLRKTQLRIFNLKIVFAQKVMEISWKLSSWLPFLRRLMRARLPNRKHSRAVFSTVETSRHELQVFGVWRDLVCDESTSVENECPTLVPPKRGSSVRCQLSQDILRPSWLRPRRAVSPLLSPHCVLIMTFSGLATWSDQPSLDCSFFGPGVLKNVWDQEDFLMPELDGLCIRGLSQKNPTHILVWRMYYTRSSYKNVGSSTLFKQNS